MTRHAHARYLGTVSPGCPLGRSQHPLTSLCTPHLAHSRHVSSSRRVIRGLQKPLTPWQTLQKRNKFPRRNTSAKTPSDAGQGGRSANAPGRRPGPSERHAARCGARVCGHMVALPEPQARTGEPRGGQRRPSIRTRAAGTHAAHAAGVGGGHVPKGSLEDQCSLGSTPRPVWPFESLLTGPVAPLGPAWPWPGLRLRTASFACSRPPRAHARRHTTGDVRCAHGRRGCGGQGVLARTCTCTAAKGWNDPGGQ